MTDEEKLRLAQRTAEALTALAALWPDGDLTLHAEPDQLIKRATKEIRKWRDANEVDNYVRRNPPPTWGQHIETCPQCREARSYGRDLGSFCQEGQRLYHADRAR